MDVGQYEILEGEARQSIKPIWANDMHKTEKGILKWFAETQPLLERIHEPRIRRMNLNLCWYLNEITNNYGIRLMVGARSIANFAADQMPIVVGHLYDLTEQKVSRLSSYKPAFDVAPTHNEESDRITARLLKPCLDAVCRNNNFDFLIQESQRHKMIFGESFTGVDWDKNAGDSDDKGNPIGDVRVYNKEPFWVFYEPRSDWRKVSFITEIDEIIHIEEARKKFNKPELQPDNLRTVFTFDPEPIKAGDEIVVYRIVYKPSPYLPNGLVVKIAGGSVVEIIRKQYPWSHKDFPYVRNTDIDVPGRVFPISFYNYLIPMQNVYNKLTALANRNIMLTAHPKWMFQKGSVDPKSLGNAATNVPYNPGSPKPELAVFNSVSGDTFSFRSDMRSEMQTLSGINGVSRGTPPAGARAASMLRFYEEQEVQRSSTDIMKHNELIRRCVSMMGAVIGDRYPESPERLIRVVGKANRYKIFRLTQVKISSNYDIIIQNSTGFSESKAGRIEEIGFLQQNVPGLLSPEQIADILEIAQPQKAYDIMTAALNQAEDENSDFMDGIPVGAPEVSDDHIIHWKTHVLFMQTETYKRLPKLYKDAFAKHVMVHEGFMEEMMNKPSSQGAQEIAFLKNFPIFFKVELPPLPAPPPPQQGGAQPPMPPAPQGAPQDMGMQELQGGVPPV